MVSLPEDQHSLLLLSDWSCTVSKPSCILFYLRLFVSVCKSMWRPSFKWRIVELYYEHHTLHDNVQLVLLSGTLLLDVIRRALRNCSFVNCINHFIYCFKRVWHQQSLNLFHNFLCSRLVGKGTVFAYGAVVVIILFSCYSYRRLPLLLASELLLFSNFSFYPGKTF